MAGAAYVIVITAAMLILPPVDEVPSDFSAITLWRFRLASLGIDAVLWTALGLVFGVFAERHLIAASVGRLDPLDKRAGSICGTMRA